MPISLGTAFKCPLTDIMAADVERTGQEQRPEGESLNEGLNGGQPANEQ